MIERLNNERCGSLLLEGVIAIGIFAIFLGGIGLSLVLGERTTIASGDRMRGVFYAEKQLEAVRQMRATNFSLLTAGLHGLALSDTGWNFSGTGNISNGYRGSVTVTVRDTDWVDVESSVRWNFGASRSGSVVLNTAVTDWRKTVTIGNWQNMTQIGSINDAASSGFRNVTAWGNYAFVSGEYSGGGKGLAIYNITDPTHPIRVNSFFHLSGGSYGAVISGNKLYLATDDPAAEVQVFDVSSPETFTLSNLIASYDLPGSGRARSVIVSGSTIIVGCASDAVEKELYTLSMSTNNVITLQGSLTMTGSVLDLALRSTSLYAATSNNGGELLVVNLADLAHPTFASGVGIDLTDVQDGNSVAASGTGILLGRVNGSTIDELTFFRIGATAVPSSPPGPWTLEIGADVNDVLIIPGSRYAFIASNASSYQLKVVDLQKFALGQDPIVQIFDAPAAIKGLTYDWLHDRLYAVTTRALLVFAPN